LGILTSSCLSMTLVFAKICWAICAALFCAAWSMTTFWFWGMTLRPAPDHRRQDY
jgi:hypothetical protein